MAGKKGRIVCISGPDGIGKTTQAKLLVRRMREDGEDVSYVWLRFSHFFSLPVLGIMRLASLRNQNRLDDRSGYHDFSRNRIMWIAYEITMFADMTLATLIKVRSRTTFGRTVVLDRFVPDTLVDMAISAKDQSFIGSKGGRTFYRIVPPNTKGVILVSDPEWLKSRRADLVEDKHLSAKISLYREVSGQYGIIALDVTEMTVEQVHDVIIHKVVNTSDDG